jgi:hypothetical protein
MAQVTIYLNDEIEAQARSAAELRGSTLGRWIAEQVAEKVKNTWSPAVLDAIGSFPDFPEEAELRSQYGKDTARDPLV